MIVTGIFMSAGSLVGGGVHLSAENTFDTGLAGVRNIVGSICLSNETDASVVYCHNRNNIK